ncbi:MAG TPA: DNA gyrase modulator, partial [Peptococcaceae bacterium]|nr:DNA gyrase modulator [Peptococcaceae bacterium]
MNEIAEKVLELAQKQGSGQAEVFLMDSREMTIEVSEQKVDNLHLAKQRGLGLRVIVGQKMGFAYSADLAAPALQKTVER